MPGTLRGEPLGAVATPLAPTVQATIADAPYIAHASTPAPPPRTPAPGFVIPAGSPVNREGIPSLAPSTIVAGRYRLEREIGKGATAAVWQATDLKLQRAVALKAFAVDDVRGERAAAVTREAQESGRVHSEFVVAIHDSCLDELLGVAAMDMELCVEYDRDSSPRFAQELGKHVVAEKPTNAQLREAARWVMQAALGVHAAHTQNVFHRDLKPANILIGAVRRRAQVADFGLAAYKIAPGHTAEGAPRQTISQNTGEGLVLAGTPAYMAPEQAQGMPYYDPRKDEDRRALVGIDVYGLGAVLYELLAGIPPHEGPEGEGVFAVIIRAMQNEVDFSLFARRGVPPRLVWILRCALATKREDRYESAEDMAGALEAFLDNRPFKARPRPRDSRLLLAAKRNPGLVGSVLLSGALLVVTLSTSAWRLDAANKQLAQAHGSLGDLGQQINDARQTITKLNADRENDSRAAESRANAAAAAAESNANQLRQQAANATGKADKERLLREAREADLKGEKEREKELAARQDAELARVKSAQANEIANLQLEQQKEIQTIKSGQIAEIANLKKEHEAELAQLAQQQQLTLKHVNEQHAATLEERDHTIATLEAEVARLEKSGHPKDPKEKDEPRTPPPAPSTEAP